MGQNFLIFHFGSVRTEKYLVKLHCEQRFLSCMAFSVYIVVQVAYKPTTRLASDTNDFTSARRVK